MTIDITIGKFQTQILKYEVFGYKLHDVELDINWVSCGVYSIHVNYLNEKSDIKKPSFVISLQPDWLKKVEELYPVGEKRPRTDCHKPFYEVLGTAYGMIDFGEDTFFQAFKDPTKEYVALTTTHFSNGIPNGIRVLTISFDEFKKLRSYLKNPNGNGPEIFYSGCVIAN